MVRKIKKRALFILGALVAGFLGLLTSYTREHYSRDNSLLVISPAKADLAIWTGDGSDSGGDGCGGCSGDASSS